MNHEAPSAGATTQYVTFDLADNVYGVELSRVREIVAAHDVVADAEVAGLVGYVALRGVNVPVVDLRRKLGLPRGPITPRSVVLVVRIADARTGAWGVLVDDVSGVFTFADAEVEPSSRLRSVNSRSLVSGIAKLDGRLVLLLDAQRLLDDESESREPQVPERWLRGASA